VKRMSIIQEYNVAGWCISMASAMILETQEFALFPIREAGKDIITKKMASSISISGTAVLYISGKFKRESMGKFS
jgi:hypothetical protein